MEPPPTPFVAITVGEATTCGLDERGAIQCWGGCDENAACAPFDINGDTSNCNCGQNQPPGGFFRAIEAGRYVTCGIRTDDTPVCFGADWRGVRDAPQESVVQLSAGWEIGCALRSDGVVRCWGPSGDVPLNVLNQPLRQVSAGGVHACGVTTERALVCWGTKDTYMRLEPPAGSFAQVAAGRTHSCAIATDGTLACWGSSFAGETTPPGQ